MATTVIKTIRAKKYLYYSYYDNGKKCERYCGIASSVLSEKKALQFKLEHLKNQKKNISEKIAEIENGLN